jgi:hypothetical protein
VAAGVFAPGHLGELTRIVPFELVDAVLEETGARERRLRLLPSRVGVYFVMAMCLFPRPGYEWTNNISERGAKTAKRHQAVSRYWHSKPSPAGAASAATSTPPPPTASPLSTPSAPPMPASPGCPRSRQPPSPPRRKFTPHP